MRGKRAKMLRKMAGFKPGTRVRYSIKAAKDGKLVCGPPRSTYLKLKKLEKGGQG